MASFGFQLNQHQPARATSFRCGPRFSPVGLVWGLGAGEFGAMFTSASPKIWYTVYGISQFMAVLLGKMAENGDQPLDFGVFVPGKVRHEVSMGHACRCQTTVVTEKRKGLSTSTHFPGDSQVRASASFNFTSVRFMLARSL